jgi:acetyl-CoA carboxylase biotin carboxyl carrier protein
MKGPKEKKQPAASAVSGVDLDQVEKLLDFMSAHGLEEFEYEHAGLHIRLRKGASGLAPAPLLQAPQVAASVHAPAVVPSASGQQAPPVAAPPAEELHIVKSPIVGTFYSAPSPEAAAFVNPGDTVREGQVLCIIEAMKLMNEIEADMGGELVQALAENGQPVEYGQPLFSIRTAKKK